MDLNFCKQCDMKLDYYIDDDSKLYLGCKVCGNKEEHTGTSCIYNNDYENEKCCLFYSISLQ